MARRSWNRGKRAIGVDRAALCEDVVQPCDSYVGLAVVILIHRSVDIVVRDRVHDRWVVVLPDEQDVPELRVAGLDARGGDRGVVVGRQHAVEGAAPRGEQALDGGRGGARAVDIRHDLGQLDLPPGGRDGLLDALLAQGRIRVGEEPGQERYAAVPAHRLLQQLRLVSRRGLYVRRVAQQRRGRVGGAAREVEDRDPPADQPLVGRFDSRFAVREYRERVVPLRDQGVDRAYLYGRVVRGSGGNDVGDGHAELLGHDLGDLAPGREVDVRAAGD